MNPYPSYKNSDVEWIGEIPSEWNSSIVSRHFFLGRGRVISKEEIEDNIGEYPVYSSQTKRNGVLGYINTFDFEGSYIAWTTDGANCGTVSYRSGKFSTTNVCGLLSIKNIDLDLPYYSYLLSIGTKSYVRIDINPKLMNNMMGEIPIILPSLQEQQQISNYLDHKTQQIDSLIEKTQQKIELLKEQRTSLINQVVTKGLNPDVEVKDSGVEWIGEIPSGWDVIRTKFLTDNLDGRRVPLNSEERREILGDYPYWGSNGVVGYVDEYLFDEQLVLVGEDGSPFFERYKDVSFFVDNKVWVNNHIHVLRNKDGILPKILVHSFNCVNYRNFITGSTRDKLNQSDLKNIPHPVPPLEQQKQIVDHLDKETSKIDQMVDTETQRIDLLKEYRQSLISNVVTGKVDVRDEVVV